ARWGAPASRVHRAGGTAVGDRRRRRRDAGPAGVVSRARRVRLAGEPRVDRRAHAPDAAGASPGGPGARPRVPVRAGRRPAARPGVGLRAVDSLVVRRDGSLFAYSYGQELSQLYLVTL